MEIKWRDLVMEFKEEKKAETVKGVSVSACLPLCRPHSFSHFLDLFHSKPKNKQTLLAFQRRPPRELWPSALFSCLKRPWQSLSPNWSTVRHFSLKLLTHPLLLMPRNTKTKIFHQLVTCFWGNIFFKPRVFIKWRKVMQLVKLLKMILNRLLGWVGHQSMS